MNQRLLPMLAVPSAPFDSAEYLFEVKWDGVRALAACGPDGAVWGRDAADYSARYPELAVLGRFPAGTVLDGELVRWGPDGLSNLGAILKRHHLTNPARIEQASRSQPVCYVVFDLLHLRGRSLLGEPLQRRREALQELLHRLQERYVVFSEGVVGAGRAFFEAKHRASGYRPGRRSSAWRKVKPARRPQRSQLPGFST